MEWNGKTDAGSFIAIKPSITEIYVPGHLTAWKPESTAALVTYNLNVWKLASLQSWMP